MKIITIAVLAFLVQNCNRNNTIKPTAGQKPAIDSLQTDLKSESGETYYDSLSVHAELKATAYSLDSIIVDVAIVNNSDESILLYKPLLPSDSLKYYETFIVRRADNNANLPYIYLSMIKHELKKPHSVLRNFKPVINDNNLFELLPHTKQLFTTNLCKHYNFKEPGIKNLKTVYLGYSMDFPYIKNGQHVYLKRPYFDTFFKPAYIHITSKNKEKEGPLGIDDMVKIVLPKK